jgi:hypothetical protein
MSVAQTTMAQTPFEIPHFAVGGARALFRWRLERQRTWCRMVEATCKLCKFSWKWHFDCRSTDYEAEIELNVDFFHWCPVIAISSTTDPDYEMIRKRLPSCNVAFHDVANRFEVQVHCQDRAELCRTLVDVLGRVIFAYE